MAVGLLLSLYRTGHSAIITDTGCSCATVRATAPGIRTNVTLGCGLWWGRATRYVSVIS